MTLKVELPNLAVSANPARNGRRLAGRLLVGLLAGSALTAPLYAQDADEEAIPEGEAIVVTGICGSIVAGLESKRKSDVVVELIKAEDIGKFPDKNLAEALQRVPGVSIDRDGGEGRFVTIRGLGPEFNTVLFNGRRIASEGYNRSFSFDTLASDLIGGVNVYKTQQAYIREGGVGGTVDVRTMRPLDRSGLQISARAEALYEKNSEKVTPNLSAQVSNTFLDDTLGVLVGLSYQKRKNLTYLAGTRELRTQGVFTAGGNDLDGDPYGIFAYDNFGVDPVYRPVEFNRSAKYELRERKGLYAALQYQPNDRLDINFDYLRSEFDVDFDNLQQQ